MFPLAPTITYMASVTTATLSLRLFISASPSCRYNPPKKSPPFRLDLGSAAINEEFDAGDETGIIRGQKQRRLGNFVGLPCVPSGSWTQSSQWRPEVADPQSAYRSDRG